MSRRAEAALRDALSHLSRVNVRLMDDNRRLTAALLARDGDVAAAVMIRPRPEKDEDETPAAPRPIGM